MTTRDLIFLDRARATVIKAKTICEATEIRDQAAAIARYTKYKEGAQEVSRHADEIKMLAEQRIGVLLEPAKEKRGGAKSTRTTLPKGITKDQSSAYQKLASIPQDIFEKALKQDGVSTASLVRLADELKRKKTGNQPQTAAPIAVPITEDRPIKPVDDLRYVALMKFSRTAERLCEQFGEDSFSVAIQELGERARLLALSVATSITQEQEGGES